MSSKDNSGTLLSVSIAGPSYRVMAEVDAAQNLAKWKAEGQATSGPTMFRMTAQVSDAGGIDIACNNDEFVLITAAAESFNDIKLGFVTASGTQWTGLGRISCDPLSHKDNKLTIKMEFTNKPTKVG